MALPCHILAQTGREVKSFITNRLRNYGNIADAYGAEYASVTLSISEGDPRAFRIIVGKLHGRMAFDARHFADEADGIKATLPAGITTAKIICEQRTPTCAESDATTGSPFAPIVEVVGAAEISGSKPAGKSPAEISVQAEDVIDIKRVGRRSSRASRGSRPRAFSHSMYSPPAIYGSLLSARLPGPVRGPIRRTLEKLGSSKSIRQHNAEHTFVSVLPQLKNFILRSLPAVHRRTPVLRGPWGSRAHWFQSLQVVFVGEESARSSREAGAQVRGHRLSQPHIPAKESYGGARTEICHAKIRSALAAARSCSTTWSSL